MSEIYLLTGMAVVTILIRYSVIGLSGRIKLLATVMQLFRYIPAAVLTAIVVPAVLMPNHELDFSYSNARLIGAIAAIVVSLWTKNLLVTIVLGMAVFFTWQWLA